MASFGSSFAGAGIVRATSVEATSYIKAPAGTPSAPGLRIGSDVAGLINSGTRLEMVWAQIERAYWGTINHNYQQTSVTGLLTASTLSAVLAGMKTGFRSITGNHTADNDDVAIVADSTAGAITITLPSAGTAGRVFIIRKDVASANAVTIDPAGAELINGAATLAVANNSAVIIESNGTGWVLVSAS